MTIRAWYAKKKKTGKNIVQLLSSSPNFSFEYSVEESLLISDIEKLTDYSYAEMMEWFKSTKYTYTDQHSYRITPVTIMASLSTSSSSFQIIC